jgi:hypothetical protein
MLTLLNMTPRTLVILTVSIFTTGIVSAFLFFYLWPIIEIKLESKNDSAKWDLILEAEKNDQEELERLRQGGNDFMTLEEYEAEKERFENIEIIEKVDEDIIFDKTFSDTQKGFSLKYPSNYKVTRPNQSLVSFRSDLDCSEVVSAYCVFQEIKVETINKKDDYTAEQWLDDNKSTYEFEKYVEISDRNSLLAFPVGTAKEDPRFIIKNQNRIYLLDFSASVPQETRDMVLSSFNFVFFDSDGIREDNLQDKIITLSKAVVSNIRNKNLYRYAHPQKGVRFSPLATINTNTDKVFSIKQMVENFDKENVLSWGSYGENGSQINLSFKDYYSNFIYDKDYSLPTSIGYNKKVGKGDHEFNFLDVYESSVFVDYYIEPNFGENSTGWSSLILIFEEYNKEWFLVGVVHDQQY